MWAFENYESCAKKFSFNYSVANANFTHPSIKMHVVDCVTRRDFVFMGWQKGLTI